MNIKPKISQINELKSNLETKDNRLDSLETYTYRPGSIIEYLSSPCDGSIIKGISGDYTWPNVTTHQDFSTAYLDITGSSINYKPPEGTSRVIYRFECMQGWQSTAHSIQHYQFVRNGIVVNNSRHNRSATHMESRIPFEWVINIGGDNNDDTGRVSSWDVPINLKMQARRYAASSHGGIIHGTYYWNGGVGNTFSRPILTLIAIA